MKDELAECAIGKTSSKPNPKNVQMSARTEELQAYGKNLKREIRTWDKCNYTRTTEYLKSERLEVTVTQSSVEPLDAPDAAFLAGAPNYQEMKDVLLDHIDDWYKQVEELSGSNCDMTRFLDISHLKIASHEKQLDKLAFGKNPNTPRTIITQGNRIRRKRSTKKAPKYEVNC